MTIAALTLLACGSSEPAPQPTPKPAEAPPTTPPTALPTGVSPLAFAARSGDSSEVTTPRHPTAELVVFTREDAWKDVPKGTPFYAVGSGGGAPVTFEGMAKGRYGCDGGNEVVWATFDAAEPFAEGVAVLFPANEFQ